MAPATDTLLEKMKALAESYVPEWSFSETDPDAGSVVALLYKNMLEGSEQRLGKVLHKHKIQYLNLFDRLRDEPAEAARSFVRFEPVAGAPGAVYVPAGTSLIASGETTDQQIVFETTHGITATTAGLAAVYATDGKNGTIVRQFSKEDNGSAERCRLTAFTGADENLEEHRLIIGVGNMFDHLSGLDVELLVSAASPEEQAARAAALSAEDMRYSVLCEDGFRPVDSAERADGGVRLRLADFRPGKENLNGMECCVIAADAPSAQDVQINGISLRPSEESLLPDEVRCGGVAQNIGHFRPFGLPLEIYAACEIESKTAFARKGASVTLSFALDFEIFDQTLPAIETETEYKIVMKRPTELPKVAVSEVRADSVLIEYLSEGGWKRLVWEEHASMLFNGSARGELALSFVLPPDILAAELAGGQPRVRLRLVRADRLYTVPCRQYCPVIDNLRISYSYAAAPQLPDRVLTRNNFDVRDITDLLRKGRSATLFYSNEHENPAMYLGFEGSPWGTPTSLYFRLENNADAPVDFTVEYRSPTGFAPVKAADGTAGMLCSGAILLVIPSDITSAPLFGKDLFWLRFINHNKVNKSYNMPEITGIYLNMAKVENACTRSEVFYLDNAAGDVNITLAGKGLIAADVFVNEQDSRDGENWVRWQKLGRREQQGRFYDIDLAAGRLTFDRASFSAYPVKEGGPSVKVVYQTYHGSSANVGEGKISTLAASIRHISGAVNPMPAYGGYDGFNEETAAAMISNMLRTWGRAVTVQDYFDVISQVTCGVRRVKCRCGVDAEGSPRDDAVTIAVLIDEYEKGGHIFSSVKEAIRDKLLSCSGLVPAGKILTLTQPRFVRMSTRLWLECGRMESAYDMQKQCGESVRRFIDPLTGGFDGEGWEIGSLPTATQLAAYLKIRHPDVAVSRIVMTASYENREYTVDDRIAKHIDSPFAMAVNGEHTLYCQLAE